MLTITAFKWVPPFAQGYVRDLRPAFKEALAEQLQGFANNEPKN